MRKLGMATATGDIVRIVDDAEVKDSVWIQWGVDDAHEEREVPLPPVVDTVDVRPTRPQPSTRHSESTRHIAAG